MRSFGRKGKKDAVFQSYFIFKMVSGDFIVNFLCCRSLVRIFRYRIWFFSSANMQQKRQHLHDRLQHEGDYREDGMEDTIEQREEKHEYHHSPVISVIVVSICMDGHVPSGTSNIQNFPDIRKLLNKNNW